MMRGVSERRVKNRMFSSASRSRHRQSWRGGTNLAIYERASRRLNRDHGYFDESSRTLCFHDEFLRAFGAQHPALAIFVDGARHLLSPGVAGEAKSRAWYVLKAGWSAYYKAVGDGEEACRHFTDASLAAGARVSSRAAASSAPNCVLHALGAYVGVAPASGAHGGDIPSALNRALAGCIRTRSDGRNEAVMTTYWTELLVDLGFGLVHVPIMGDLVVYTILKPGLANDDGCCAPRECAVHFGRLVDASDGLMVESKSGYAFHVYAHPLNVVDPTYLIESPSMRVHFFRPRSPPLPAPELAELAARYTERMRREHGT